MRSSWCNSIQHLIVIEKHKEVKSTVFCYILLGALDTFPKSSMCRHFSLLKIESEQHSSGLFSGRKTARTIRNGIEVFSFQSIQEVSVVIVIFRFESTRVWVRMQDECTAQRRWTEEGKPFSHKLFIIWNYFALITPTIFLDHRCDCTFSVLGWL